MMNYEIFEELNKFRKWASTVSGKFGEWECNYERWQEMYSTFISYLQRCSPTQVTKSEISDLIYAIARDNEDERLISLLSERPAWFKALLVHIFDCDEPDAKWQFADVLGNNILQFPETESALLRLINDKNEYVTRRALHSLGKIGSKHAEALCERAWNSDHEYQRMMALTVLKEIGSKKLQKYLVLAEEDGRKYIVLTAEKINNA